MSELKLSSHILISKNFCQITYNYIALPEGKKKEKISLSYTGYQIPRGELFGLVYNPVKETATAVKRNGEPMENPFPKSSNTMRTQMLWEMLKGVNKNYSKLAEDSEITFWCMFGGGFEEKDCIYGCDFIPKFIVLIAIDWDGLMLRVEDFYSSYRVLENMAKVGLYYIGDFPKLKVNLEDLDATKGEIKEFLMKDLMKDQIKGIDYSNDDTSYGILLLPDYPLFYQRPLTWTIQTNNSL